ncbi:MAG: YCF48-related protein [Oleiphilaceae bacterium]|nr:YCF48-related protein [Oleiphilaceae bacterium]
MLETPAMETDLAAESLLLNTAQSGDRMVAVGERGHIIYSDDFGQTWIQAEVPVRATLTGVYFPTPEKGWAVGHGGVILHSSDRGETWVKQLDGFEGQKKIIAYLEKQIEKKKAELEAAEDPDERADLRFELEDIEFTLEDAMADAEAGPWQPLMDVWFADEKRGLAVGSYGMIFLTTDGGKTWKNHMGAINNPRRFNFNAISQTADGALFLAVEAGIVHRSTDKGETWVEVQTPYDGSFFGVVGTSKPDQILAFGLRGNIYRSENLGDDWSQIDTDIDRTINSGNVGDNGDIVLVANDGAILRSTDDGKTFTTYTRPSRQSFVDVLVMEGKGLLLVGEGGAVLTDGSGRDFTP